MINIYHNSLNNSLYHPASYIFICSCVLVQF